MPKRRKTSRSVCPSGKAAYRDWVAAELVLENVQRFARRTIHNEKRTYHCSLCGRWHLSSQDKGLARSA